MAGFNPNDYETVDERIHKFWTEAPSGAIRTHLVSDDGERVVFRAEVYRDRDSSTPDATGYADEVKGQGNVNRTNHVENCETSAIGRALANFGYATKGKRPSREEMSKTEASVEAQVPAVSRVEQAWADMGGTKAEWVLLGKTDADRKAMVKRAKENGWETAAEVCRFAQVKVSA